MQYIAYKSFLTARVNLRKNVKNFFTIDRIDSLIYTTGCQVQNDYELAK